MFILRYKINYGCSHFNDLKGVKVHKCLNYDIITVQTGLIRCIFTGLADLPFMVKGGLY